MCDVTIMLLWSQYDDVTVLGNRDLVQGGTRQPCCIVRALIFYWIANGTTVDIMSRPGEGGSNDPLVQSYHRESYSLPLPVYKCFTGYGPHPSKSYSTLRFQFPFHLSFGFCWLYIISDVLYGVFHAGARVRDGVKFSSPPCSPHE